MNNYITFSSEYDKDGLLSLYNSLKSQNKCEIKLCFEVADLTDIDQSLFPMMHIFDRVLSIQEYGLAELLTETGMHENPGNNGLIMFPLSGLIGFTFEDGTTIEIAQPTATNGRVLHTYYPIVSPAIFFAIKIPMDK
jgi:hypothetical protein